MKKNFGSLRRVKKITTPHSTFFVGINESDPKEKQGLLDYGWDVGRIKREADTLMSYKDSALGKKKFPSDEERHSALYKDLSDEEFKEKQQEWQKEAKEKYETALHLKKLKKIQPVGIVRLSEREIYDFGKDEKTLKDWDKELEEKMDIDFVKRLTKVAGDNPNKVKVEDAPEFIGLTPEEAHKKAYPPREIVSPEDPFIELTPAVYNKKGKEGDFQIRGKGPYGTLEEIKNQFPGKKIRINWGRATEEID